jgi:hypothetical protein
MPTPKNGVTFRPELGILAYAYALEASLRGFIGLQMFPIFETALQSAQYPVIPAEVFLKLYETKRTARAGYGRSDYEFDDGDYSCKENGWEELLDDSERKLYSRFFDAEVVAIQRAVDIILRRQEKRVADKCTATGSLPNGAAPKKWDDPNASPRTDVRGKVKLMRDTIGLEPSRITVSWDTFQDLLVCKELNEYLKYTTSHLLEPVEVQKRIIAQWLGLGEVMVGNAIYDSAKKGQTLVPANIWPNDKAVLSVAPTNAMDLKQPVLGRTFLWTEDSPQNLTTESYRDEPKRSDVYRVRQYTDEAYVFTAAGYIITGVK